MTLSDFVKKETGSSKIILANRTGYANSLLRKLNIREEVDIFDVQPMLICDIARELVTAYAACAEDGIFPDLIGQQEAVYVLDKAVHENELASFPSSSLNLSTVREILVNINEIRMNDHTESFDKTGDRKIADIKKIIECYEKALEDGKMYDDVRILGEAIDLIDKADDNADLSFLLPWADKGVIIADLASNRWSDLERRFAALAAEKLGSDLYVIDDVAQTDEISINVPSENISIYKAYGMANEVEQIASLIKEKDRSYGDTVIYYADSAYVNYIKAAFDAERIPYVLTGGYPATELNLTQMMLDLIASAKEDYSYELLEKVALNPRVTFKNVVGKDEVRANPIHAYRAAIGKGIGWGRDRYLAFKDNIDEENDEEKLFADMLIDYCDAFDGSKTTSEILEKLWEFVRKYTYPNNPERAKLADSVWQQVCDLKRFDDKNLNLNDKLGLIEDFLGTLTVTDESDPAAVSVSSLNGIQVVERGDVYIAGMSAGSFSSDTRQSPILLDSEKTEYLANAEEPGSSVQLAGQRNRLRRRDLIRTLAGIDGGNVTFLYCKYDTTDLKESSPSVMILEIQDALGIRDEDVKEAVGYKVAREDVKVDSKELREAISIFGKKKKEEVDKKAAEQTKPDKSRIRMSATGLQTFLSCPLLYYYTYVKGLRIYDQKKPLASSWLQPFSKGNLCHYSMEEYFKTKMPPNAFDAAVDKDFLRRIVKEQAEEIEKVEPYISRAVREREEDYCYCLMESYLEDRVSGWNSEHEWKVIGCEIGFGREEGDDIEYIGSSTEEKCVKLLFNGSIDRMDGYTDDKGVLHLRIVDYKTGKKESKQKEVDEGVQIQHILYAIAAKAYLEKHDEELRKLFEVSAFAGYSFDWIGYEFPYESPENYLLDVTNSITNIEGNVLSGKLEDIKIDFAAETKDRMNRIIGAYQADDIAAIAADCEKIIADNIADAKAKLNEESSKGDKDYTLKDYCSGRYCDYRSVCRKWVGGAEDEA